VFGNEVVRFQATPAKHQHGGTLAHAPKRKRYGQVGLVGETRIRHIPARMAGRVKDGIRVTKFM
jgi:hypothetical protein